eukprot:g40046.t1
MKAIDSQRFFPEVKGQLQDGTGSRNWRMLQHRLLLRRKDAYRHKCSCKIDSDRNWNEKKMNLLFIIFQVFLVQQPIVDRLENFVKLVSQLIREQMEEQVAQKSTELQQYLQRVKELEEMYKRLEEALEDERQARQEEESVRKLQA